MAHLLEKKIKSLNELRKIVSSLKMKGKRIILTNGCFDLLHYGHVKYLQDAKRKGEILVVAVNSDASVRRIKGPGRPIMNEKDRARIIAALESVDYVVLFRENTPLKIIRLLRPEVLVKGADWRKKDIVGRDIVLSYGGRVDTIKLIKNRSSSNFIKKIVKTS
jgi:D-beta-D-heptose 7-phosphate kinase/D-beta-D-heptose 1-phosphate adenosyltransferase